MFSPTLIVISSPFSMSLAAMSLRMPVPGSMFLTAAGAQEWLILENLW